MAYPTLILAHLAEFSGRPALSYNATYVPTALSQATLLFKIGTCLADFPSDPVEADLAKMAILSMADMIVLAQPTQKAAASPFSSETIGSYSYSKTAKQASRGEETGVMWFDLAIQKLSVCNSSDGVPSGGGIEIFEHDGTFVSGNNGNSRLLGPGNVDAHPYFGVSHSN